MRSFSQREKTTFGAGERFSTTPDPRPAFYGRFEPLSHVAQGRAVSAVGTFTTGPKGGCFDVHADDVPFRVIAHDVAPAHSRGVKRTGPRFVVTSEADQSPGPIYKPLVVQPAAGVKFNNAPRFLPPKPDETPVVKRKKLAEYVAAARAGAGTGEASLGVCSFGIRHAHLERQQDVSGTEPVGPADPLAQIPEYAGKFGSAHRTTGLGTHASASSGAGSHLKLQAVVDTPQWTIGWRRTAPVSTTPGPGAYNIAKYKPFSKPDRPTFARTVHDGKLFTVLGRDSPGPALYSELALPKAW